MTPVSWALLGLALAGITIWGAVKILGAIITAVSEGCTALKLNVIGRKNSSQAILDIPKELSAVPLSSPMADPVIRNLNKWTPEFEKFPSPAWPKWKSIWIGEGASALTTTIAEIESVLKPLPTTKPPYELIDNPPQFKAKMQSTKEGGPPPEPEILPEEFPSPMLVLPRWGGPLAFLNSTVRNAHKALIEKRDLFESKRAKLIESAKLVNQERRQAWKNAFDRYESALQLFRQERDQYAKGLRINNLNN
jgi:hypothetical protein